MNTIQECTKFIEWFEQALRAKPGMFGSLAEISAMFYIVDNVNNICIYGERLPTNLSWNEFLIGQGLLKDSRVIDESLGYEKFVELRRQYLDWRETQRAQ
jgi:hypothetical protein